MSEQRTLLEEVDEIIEPLGLDGSTLPIGLYVPLAQKDISQQINKLVNETWGSVVYYNDAVSEHLECGGVLSEDEIEAASADVERVSKEVAEVENKYPGLIDIHIYADTQGLGWFKEFDEPKLEILQDRYQAWADKLYSPDTYFKVAGLYNDLVSARDVYMDADAKMEAGLEWDGSDSEIEEVALSREGALDTMDEKAAEMSKYLGLCPVFEFDEYHTGYSVDVVEDFPNYNKNCMRMQQGIVNRFDPCAKSDIFVKDSDVIKEIDGRLFNRMTLKNQLNVIDTRLTQDQKVNDALVEACVKNRTYVYADEYDGLGTDEDITKCELEFEDECKCVHEFAERWPEHISKQTLNMMDEIAVYDGPACVAKLAEIVVPDAVYGDGGVLVTKSDKVFDKCSFEKNYSVSDSVVEIDTKNVQKDVNAEPFC